MTRKVLVADDTPQIRKIFSKVLRRDGIEVTEVDNGDEVFEASLKAQVGLILLDLDMPGRDHSDNLELLRSHAETSNIPVVIITGNDDRGELEQVLSEGASDYIIKPPNLTQLRNRVNAYLGISALTSQAGEITRERRNLYIAVARLAEAREPDYLNHGQRVASLTELLCRQLTERGVTLPNQLEICLASPLHDLGKTTIPSSILLKSGKLSPEEFEIVKQHCEAGAQALEAYNLGPEQSDFLSVAKEIALSHHERWDGLGYPNKLSGEAIPISARIVSLAEVYDALTSRRPYREAYTHQESLDILKAASGTQFDPNLVEALLVVEKEFDSIRMTHPG